MCVTVPCPPVAPPHLTVPPLTSPHRTSIQAALNVVDSVEELGMYGEAGERLWVRTGTEALHLWEWLSATSEEHAGGHGAFCHFEDARALAAQAADCSEAAAALEQVRGARGGALHIVDDWHKSGAG